MDTLARILALRAQKEAQDAKQEADQILANNIIFELQRLQIGETLPMSTSDIKEAFSAGGNITIVTQDAYQYQLIYRVITVDDYGGETHLLVGATSNERYVYGDNTWLVDIIIIDGQSQDTSDIYEISKYSVPEPSFIIFPSPIDNDKWYLGELEDLSSAIQSDTPIIMQISSDLGIQGAQEAEVPASVIFNLVSGAEVYVEITIQASVATSDGLHILFFEATASTTEGSGFDDNFTLTEKVIPFS